jgi:hypothetical protein
MSSTEYIHETIIKDIVDVATDVKDMDEIKGFLKGRGSSYKSIAHASEELTLVFPVICTRNMDITNAQMISKAIERKCTIMLQILFNSVAYSDYSNAQEYISKSHTNIKLSNNFDLDEFLDATEKLLPESADMTNSKWAMNQIKESLIADRDRYKNVYAPENVSENAINDYKILNNMYGDNNVVLNKVTTNEGSAQDVSASIKAQKDNQDILRNQIIDTDIKKANELIPTTMVVNFMSYKNGAVIPTQCIVGVKAKLYPAASEDIVSHLSGKYSDNNKLNKFVRATTREISFFKDFLFAIDKAKFDAISSADRSSSAKMWRVLERRSKKSKLRRAMGSKNDASAITTLVVNQEEIEYAKKMYNIDFSNPAVIRGIMESYNLMCFVIVDEVNEYAKFLFDTGEDSFETLSFSSLERESSDSTYKKVVNLMTKMK